MSRRCSHCSNNTHNSCTCPSSRVSGSGAGVKLFGVRRTDGSVIKKSASMGSLSALHYNSSSSAAASPNPSSPSPTPPMDICQTIRLTLPAPLIAVPNPRKFHQFGTPVPIVEFLHHMPPRPNMKEVHSGQQGKMMFDIPCENELFMRHSMDRRGAPAVPTWSPEVGERRLAWDITQFRHIKDSDPGSKPCPEVLY